MFIRNILTNLILFKVAVQTSKFGCDILQWNELWYPFFSDYLAPIPRQTLNKTVYYVAVVIIFIVFFVYKVV